MRIRKARFSDLDQIVDLWWEMHTSHYKYDRAYYKLRTKKVAIRNIETHYTERIDSPDSIFLVAENKGILIGYLYALIQDRPSVFPASKRILIDATVVREDYRRKGIFTKLYLRMEKIASKVQPSFIELFVDHNNPAIDTYKNLGFKDRHIKMYREYGPNKKL